MGAWGYQGPFLTEAGMNSATPPVDEMHYERLAQDALRGVIRAALQRAAEPEGLPGAHHFYITFQTRAPGVMLPPDVVAKYPEEITVVLQHQYENLEVEDDHFSVMLRFGGVPKAMTVPYRAITRFFDPSVQFLLQVETVIERGRRGGPGRARRPAAFHRRRRPQGRLTGPVPEKIAKVWRASRTEPALAFTRCRRPADRPCLCGRLCPAARLLSAQRKGMGAPSLHRGAACPPSHPARLG